jgi:hypothetical protein
VQHYFDAGYQAIIMEWDNPFRCHQEWGEWRHFPQQAVGSEEETIPIIWADSILFQKISAVFSWRAGFR